MRIHIIAIGHRRTGREQDGFREYARRMPPELSIELHEIAPSKRTKRDSAQPHVADEASRLIAAIPAGARVVALDERGAAWATRELANRIEHWMLDGAISRCSSAVRTASPRRASKRPSTAGHCPRSHCRTGWRGSSLRSSSIEPPRSSAAILIAASNREAMTHSARKPSFCPLASAQVAASRPRR